MKTNNKIAAFIFAICLLMSTFFFVGLHLHKWIVKLEMKEKLEQENLVRISVDKQKQQWKTDHEMLIDGKMFDVHAVEEMNGQLLVTGLFDEIETDIDNQLKSLHQQSTNSQEKQALQAFFQTILFYNDLAPFTSEINEWTIARKFNLFIQAEHLPFSPGKFTPPPEV